MDNDYVSNYMDTTNVKSACIDIIGNDIHYVCISKSFLSTAKLLVQRDNLRIISVTDLPYDLIIIAISKGKVNEYLE